LKFICCFLCILMVEIYLLFPMYVTSAFFLFQKPSNRLKWVEKFVRAQLCARTAYAFLLSLFPFRLHK
jgi:hypothetical protein